MIFISVALTLGGIVLATIGFMYGYFGSNEFSDKAKRAEHFEKATDAFIFVGILFGIVIIILGGNLIWYMNRMVG